MGNQRQECKYTFLSEVKNVESGPSGSESHLKGQQPHCSHEEKGLTAPENNTNGQWDNLDNAINQPNTLGSFLLAENLLKQSSKNNLRDAEISVGKRKAESSHSDQTPSAKKERFLDIFLNDLEEINEIPFFDIELPRELALKIFKHLDYKDLCRCAQVSQAWKSLSEDELLWCWLCQAQKYDDAATVERTDWKDVFKEYYVRDITVNANWKNRTGAFYKLHFAKGGVLCAASSYGSKIVAGYTSGEVKFWHIEADEECTFQPSSVALEIDEREQEGVIGNQVTAVATNDTHTVAGYQQGYVDIWSNKTGTTAQHSFRGPSAVSAIYLTKSEPTMAVACGNYVRVESLRNGSFTMLDALDFEGKVSFVRLVPRWSTRAPSQLLVAAYDNCVETHVPGENQSQRSIVHNSYSQKVTCLDCRANQLVYAIQSSLGPLDSLYQVKVHCLDAGSTAAEIRDIPSHIKCVNITDSPPHLFVTGNSDRSVRVCDIRLGCSISCLRGHGTAVSAVQMDEWKIVSGATDGMTCIWDQRMNRKLWEFHTRHPVEYLKFEETMLVTANIPVLKNPLTDDFDGIPSIRYRGILQVYDFSADQATKGVPSICASTYDEAPAYNYNIRLAMPYDNV